MASCRWSRVVIAPARFGMHSQGSCARLVMAGEWDCSAAPSLEAALGGCIAARQTIEVDLTTCTFCEVATLGALVRAQRAARANGCSLEIVLPAHATTTRRIFEVAGVLEIIPWREAGTSHTLPTGAVWLL